jgi:hypothetical protein
MTRFDYFAKALMIAGIAGLFSAAYLQFEAASPFKAKSPKIDSQYMQGYQDGYEHGRHHLRSELGIDELSFASDTRNDAAENLNDDGGGEGFADWLSGDTAADQQAATDSPTLAGE